MDDINSSFSEITNTCPFAESTEDEFEVDFQEEGERQEIITVPPDFTPRRLDAALAELTSLSRSRIVRLSLEKRIMKTDKSSAAYSICTKKDLLYGGDTVKISIPPDAPCKTEPEDIPLDIVYEDNDVIIINKPSGMVVHPSPGHERGTLVSALLYHCRGRLSSINGELRPGIVHRIDKDTSGLIAAAKNDDAHRALAAQLENHTMHREYAAFVTGRMTGCGTVNAPIGRHPSDRKRMAVVKNGRFAVTHWTAEEEYHGFTLLSVKLETGRTHQIRVHMKSIGHPIMGDEVYGGGKTQFEKKHAGLFEGQCLHAYKLSFKHPSDGRDVFFTCPLPPNLLRLRELLSAL